MGEGLANAPGAEGVSARTMALAMIAVGGLAACITLGFLGMRAVMDVGGSCADGGPYVSAQSCPDGAVTGLFLGIFGGFGFGALGTVMGSRIGGVWSSIPVLAWSGLFLSLGWNFLDYGVFNTPPGAGMDIGYLLPGVVFVLMGGVPLAGVIAVARAGELPAPMRPALRSPAMSVYRRPARPSAVSDDPIDRLERLATLRRDGLLTDDEYEAAKAVVLRGDGA